MQLRGGGDLMLDGQVVPFPSSLRRILTSPLLGPADKARFLAYMARLLPTQRGELVIDERHDLDGALAELAPAGGAATERIVRPLMEGPFFARLDEMSAALLRSWLRVLAVGTFFHVDGGMDSPWRVLGERLGVRTGVRVESVRASSGGVEVTAAGTGPERFDGAVVALPAPVAAGIVEPAAAPPWLADVPYSPHVRLYAARRAAGPPRSSVHVFPNELVATAEIGGGRYGAWGEVPADWTWALVCAPGASSGPLLDAPEDEVIERLWSTAATIEPRLFDLASADVVHLIRWPHAVPAVGPGYFTRLRELRQEPPIVFAGDWLVQPCVEGAVRSGERAARCFPPANGGRVEPAR